MPAREHGDPPPKDIYDDFSSPPCYAHEVDPAYLGLEPAVDPVDLHALKLTLDAAIRSLGSIRIS